MTEPSKRALKSSPSFQICVIYPRSVFNARALVCSKVVSSMDDVELLDGERRLLDGKCLLGGQCHLLGLHRTAELQQRCQCSACGISASGGGANVLD